MIEMNGCKCVFSSLGDKDFKENMILPVIFVLFLSVGDKDFKENKDTRSQQVVSVFLCCNKR